MKKVIIALLFLATMPLYGTRSKKPHRTPSRAHYLSESAARRAEICRNNKQHAEQQLLYQRLDNQAAQDTTQNNHEDVCFTTCSLVLGACCAVFEGWIRYMGMPNPGSVNTTK